MTTGLQIGTLRAENAHFSSRFCL